MWERGEGCRDAGRDADKDAGRDAGWMDESWQANGSEAGSQEGGKEPRRVPPTHSRILGGIRHKTPGAAPHGARGKRRVDLQGAGQGGSRVTLQEETSQGPAESFTIYTVYLL